MGTPIKIKDVERALENRLPKVLAIVHAETSTGVLQPLEEIGRLTKAAGALLLWMP